MLDLAVFALETQYGIWGIEPWFFKVYSGDARAELYRKLMPADKYDQKKFDKIKKHSTEAQYYIALCLKAGTNPKIPLIEETNAVACAVQYIYHLLCFRAGRVLEFWRHDLPSWNEECAKLGRKGLVPWLLHVGEAEGYR